MKKLLLVAVIALFSLTATAQGTFKLGATIGLPSADASDYYKVSLGIDAYYMFMNVDSFINLGVNAGYRHHFAEEMKVFGTNVSGDDAQFVPLAAAARLKLFGIVNGGLDLGYALGINDGNDGGFYVRPVVGIDIADTIELIASYEHISVDGGSFGNLNAGILFEF